MLALHYQVRHQESQLGPNFALNRYDVISKMETFSEDTQFILQQAGLEGKLEVEWKHRTGGDIAGSVQCDSVTLCV